MLPATCAAASSFAHISARTWPRRFIAHQERPAGEFRVVLRNENHPMDLRFPASSAMRASAVSWLEAGARFQNDGLNMRHKTPLPPLVIAKAILWTQAGGVVFQMV
jgi:hypothetical protein